MGLNEVDGSTLLDKKQSCHSENAKLGHFFILVKCKE